MRRRMIGLFLALLMMVALLLPVTVWAASDANKGVSTLTLSYYNTNQKRALSDVSFYIYRVGDYVSGPAKGTYDYQPTRDFEDAHVDLTGLNFWTGVNSLTDLVNAMASYTKINANTVKPTVTGKTDSEGTVAFRSLSPGLYLVWGESTEVTEADGAGGTREWTFVPQSFLIPLPWPDTKETFLHDVKADVKYEQLPPPTARYIDVSVEKVWEPAGQSHPGSATVVLLRNGVVTEQATLNAGNGWKHTWTGLDPTLHWEVGEKDVPDGYTHDIRRDDGYLFTVVNTREGSKDDDTTPSSTPSSAPSSKPTNKPGWPNIRPSTPTAKPSSTPPATGSGTPAASPSSPPASSSNPAPTSSHMPTAPSSSPTDPYDPSIVPYEPSTEPADPSPAPTDPSDTPMLPQTGQLWWPVPVLIALGVVLLLVGTVLVVKKEKPHG